MRTQRKVREPSPVWSPRAPVWRAGGRGERLLGAGRSVAQGAPQFLEATPCRGPL